MSVRVLIIAVVFFGWSCSPASAVTVQDGDIIFQTSLSAQSQAVQLTGFLFSIPMLATFALASNEHAHFSAVPVIMTAIVTPLSEEVLFRGYVAVALVVTVLRNRRQAAR